MYWQDVTLVDSMAPTLICLSSQVELDFAKKQAFSLSFVKLKFSFENFDKEELFTTQVFPSSFNLRNWDEEILEQLQNHVAQNCP
jgi:hypothetical protein